ncbi:hypothetical protein T439DRAFT_31301 [Meredithblackwellia eburnea MCA 4105]
MRSFVLATTGYIVTVLAISGFAAPLLAAYLTKNGVVLEREMGTVSADVLAYLSPLNVITFTVVPALFCSLCYRFDYSLHLSSTLIDTSSAPVPQMVFAEIPTNSNSRLCKIVATLPFFNKLSPAELSVGMRVPTEGPGAFGKVYFATALGSWIFTQLLCIFLSTTIPVLSSRSTDITFFMMFLSFPLSVLLTSLAVLVVAAVRGEFLALWTYVEEWAPGAAVAGQEITIPSFESEKEVFAKRTALVVSVAC